MLIPENKDNFYCWVTRQLQFKERLLGHRDKDGNIPKVSYWDEDFNDEVNIYPHSFVYDVITALITFFFFYITLPSFTIVHTLEWFDISPPSFLQFGELMIHVFRTYIEAKGFYITYNGFTVVFYALGFSACWSILELISGVFKRLNLSLLFRPIASKK